MVYLGSKSVGSLPVLTYDEDCESSQHGDEYGSVPRLNRATYITEH